MSTQPNPKEVSYEGPAPVRIPEASGANRFHQPDNSDESSGDLVCNSRISASAIGAGAQALPPPSASTHAGARATTAAIAIDSNYGRDLNSGRSHIYQNNHLEDCSTKSRVLRSRTASEMLMDTCRIGPSFHADDDAARERIMSSYLEDDSREGAKGDDEEGNSSFGASGWRSGAGSLRAGDPSDPLCGNVVVSGPCFFSPPPIELDPHPMGSADEFPSMRKPSAIGTDADGNFLRMSCYRRGE